MNGKRIYLALIAITILTAQTAIAGAQQGQDVRRPRSGWATISRAARADIGIQGHDAIRDSIQTDSVEPAAVDARRRLVGTWVITVPDAPDSPGFSALQTFNEDGTMTETSSLLGQLPEGPAHGVWDGKKSDYAVTFELFAFDPSGVSVGRIRVRASIHLINDDNLTADTAVDFIDPDGTITPNIGSGPFTGKRIQLVPVN
jgi:hypothetical protein